MLQKVGKDFDKNETEKLINLVIESINKASKNL